MCRSATLFSIGGNERGTLSRGPAGSALRESEVRHTAKKEREAEPERKRDRDGGGKFPPAPKPPLSVIPVVIETPPRRPRARQATPAPHKHYRRLSSALTHSAPPSRPPVSPASLPRCFFHPEPPAEAPLRARVHQEPGIDPRTSSRSYVFYGECYWQRDRLLSTLSLSLPSFSCIPTWRLFRSAPSDSPFSLPFSRRRLFPRSLSRIVIGSRLVFTVLRRFLRGLR